MKRVACLMNAGTSEMLLDGLAAFETVHGPRFDVAVHYAHDLEGETADTVRVREDLRRADLVLLDVRGSGRASALAAGALADGDNTVVLLVGGSPDLLSLVRMGSFSMKAALARRKSNGGGNANVARVQSILRWVERIGDLLPFGAMRHVRNWNRAMRYWTHGGPENVGHLLAFLGREYLGLSLPKPAAPREYPEAGIYDPLGDRFHEDRSAYRNAVGFDPERPTVGLLFYGGMHFAQSVVGARALAERLAPEHNLLPVYATAGRNLEAIQRFFLDGETAAVDAAIYVQWFQLATFSGENGDRTRELLRRLNVPIYAAAPMFGREIVVWRESAAGFSPVETLTAVILPELDGMIEPLPVLGLEERPHPATGRMVRAATPIPVQADAAARRVAARVRLRRRANAEKRIAFVIYNQPPGEDNIGNAAYLDVFESLRAVWRAMAARGYRVGELPPGSEVCRRLISTGAVNNARWVPREVALADGVALPAERFQALAPDLAADPAVTERWGSAPGEIMAGEGKIILPGLQLENVFLGLQPARGIHSDPEGITHDKTLPPHHQYNAFYRWLETEFRADAVVHVGTHGTLEFLKGKEAGLSAADCFPVRLMGSVPHFYIYHVVNPSEAMIAKRRGLATVVNYNSPPVTVSGVYAEYADLEDRIAEHLEAETADPDRAGRVAREIRAAAEALHLPGDDIPRLQETLARMKRALIPRGLHVLDETLSAEERAETLCAWLRHDRGEIPALHRVLARERGLDHDRLLAAPTDRFGGRVHADLLAEVDADALTLVRKSLEAGTPAGDGDRAAPLTWALEMEKRLTAGREIPALLDALEGRFTEPGIGGEPCRDPEALPTGRNSYQFDPRLVPSEAACERGREIAENTLAHFHGLHGRYPESTAVILWGFETAKTRGETVGQVFGYLGVRPVRKSPWKTELSVIPAAELGRPRVDVTVQICGFFRDMFMNVVELINRASALVAELEEDDGVNFVRPHTRAALTDLSKRLSADRLSPDRLSSDRARRIAAARVFGPRPGEYGTRVTSLIETGAWKTEDDLVRTFTDSMNHLYADNIHGERQAEVYRSRLAATELVSQVRDTHDYEIADLDHYYEYFGGLSRTITAVRGEAPVQLITDTTGERLRTETVKESLEHGLRTRLLNPKWIDGMLEHEVHGAQQIGDRVQYLVGFAATTGAVDDWVFSAVADRFLNDPEMRDRLTANNPYAAAEIARRLSEAHRRGYWNADAAELERLRDAYLAIEGEVEDGLDF